MQSGRDGGKRRRVYSNEDTRELLSSSSEKNDKESPQSDRTGSAEGEDDVETSSGDEDMSNDDSGSEYEEDDSDPDESEDDDDEDEDDESSDEYSSDEDYSDEAFSPKPASVSDGKGSGPKRMCLLCSVAYLSRSPITSKCC